MISHERAGMKDGHKKAQKAQKPHSAFVLFVPLCGSPILRSILRPDQ